ncbi:hypothetical protein QRX50_00275 [Amycolatopsis carbonis]|uniref:Uncharacterized protein n=1 Tax=Amycolatopsis carbonis TaxID=715471 RepID=A0A9Y2IHK5_9PSEU|nr:hypothetical protein [Amycolatopsis sp. 2-15]WIX79290.1 hypothetical protein QRX50_00275 [Amycolatopsis sp. 2-15]
MAGGVVLGAGTYLTQLTPLGWTTNSIATWSALAFLVGCAGGRPSWRVAAPSRLPGRCRHQAAPRPNTIPAEGGWDCDESPQALGKRFQLPEQFESRRDEILGRLEPIDI